MDFMLEALKLAQAALEAGDVPVGAVIVRSNEVLARGLNTREADLDMLGHAEINAMRAASKALGSWRLSECTLYVTLEPCAMCAAAAVSAQLSRIVFGAFDPERGACGSAVDLTRGNIGKSIEVVGGIYEARCSALLSDFFAARRGRASAPPPKS